MAEIKIEKKKPVWPWIVVGLIIAALLYFLLLSNTEAQSESKVEIENSTSVRQKVTDKQQDNSVISPIDEIQSIFSRSGTQQKMNI